MYKSIIYYNYHPDQLKPGESWERLVLEGGNRTRSIISFIEGTPMDHGTKKRHYYTMLQNQKQRDRGDRDNIL